MLTQTLQKQIITALKEKNMIRLDTLRMLSSALKYAAIDKREALTEAEELDVVKKEAKKRNDAIEAYTSANAIERAMREQEELSILKEFLPEEMSDELLLKLVIDAVSKEGNDFGKVMKAVMAAAGGQADGKKVSELVRANIAS